MNHLTELTQFESGKAVLVDLNRATMIAELPARSELGFEAGKWTLINMPDSQILVTETINQIRAMPSVQSDEVARQRELICRCFESMETRRARINELEAEVARLKSQEAAS